MSIHLEKVSLTERLKARRAYRRLVGVDSPSSLSPRPISQNSMPVDFRLCATASDGPVLAFFSRQSTVRHRLGDFSVAWCGGREPLLTGEHAQLSAREERPAFPR